MATTSSSSQQTTTTTSMMMIMLPPSAAAAAATKKKKRIINKNNNHVTIDIDLKGVSIYDLPDECLSEHIFSFLNANDLLRASQVCKRWRQAQSHISNMLWRNLAVKHGYITPDAAEGLHDTRVNNNDAAAAAAEGDGNDNGDDSRDSRAKRRISTIGLLAPESNESGSNRDDTCVVDWKEFFKAQYLREQYLRHFSDEERRELLSPPPRRVPLFWSVSAFFSLQFLTVVQFWTLAYMLLIDGPTVIYSALGWLGLITVTSDTNYAFGTLTTSICYLALMGSAALIVYNLRVPWLLKHGLNARVQILSTKPAKTLPSVFYIITHPGSTRLVSGWRQGHDEGICRAIRPHGSFVDAELRLTNNINKTTVRFYKKQRLHNEGMQYLFDPNDLHIRVPITAISGILRPKTDDKNGCNDWIDPPTDRKSKLGLAFRIIFCCVYLLLPLLKVKISMDGFGLSDYMTTNGNNRFINNLSA